MALMKEGLWNIVEGTEAAPGQENDRYAKFLARRDRALAIIVLSIEPSLLYLVGDPEDPAAVWGKLANQFQKRTWANKLELRRNLSRTKIYSQTRQESSLILARKPFSRREWNGTKRDTRFVLLCNESETFVLLLSEREFG